MYLSIRLYQLLNTGNNCPLCDLSSHMCAYTCFLFLYKSISVWSS